MQPLYLRAQGGRIPELKRVVVAHESRVAMEETLEAGLTRLFGGAGATLAAAPAAAAPTAASPTGVRTAADTGAASTARLAREANEAYERARAAQRADDWATYGDGDAEAGRHPAAAESRATLVTR